MPKYYFKLVDSSIVADHGVHELPNPAVACSEAFRLAHSLHETRPELRGQHCSISVTDELGTGICIIPLDGI